jgi:hypothetical protein
VDICSWCNQFHKKEQEQKTSAQTLQQQLLTVQTRVGQLKILCKQRSNKLGQTHWSVSVYRKTHLQWECIMEDRIKIWIMDNWTTNNN